MSRSTPPAPTAPSASTAANPWARWAALALLLLGLAGGAAWFFRGAAQPALAPSPHALRPDDPQLVERGAAIESMITMREGDVILVPERRLFE